MSYRAFPGLNSLNGNLLCAVDVETTGLEYDKHDIIEIAILPLDNAYRPQTTVLPFNMLMCPRRPENIDPAALTIRKNKLTDCILKGMDPYRTQDLLLEWFEKLNLGTHKRISPLAHNWPFDHHFLSDWLGPKTMELIFDTRFRDTMALALSANDMAEQRGLLQPYAKVNLAYIAGTLRIPHTDAHNALPDCRITAEVYAEMITRHCSQ